MQFHRSFAYTVKFGGIWAGSFPAALGMRLMRMTGPLALAVFVATATAGAQARFDAEAVRLNNRGVAQMSQQFTERASSSFAEAFQKDPKLAQAVLNEGIALMALQKLDEAKKALQQAIALEPNNAQAWYNLGLAQHAGNELEPALASFQQAVKIDPGMRTPLTSRAFATRS
jgi:tetratricopeptide (TPR) repeat protein